LDTGTPLQVKYGTPFGSNPVFHWRKFVRNLNVLGGAKKKEIPQGWALKDGKVMGYDGIIHRTIVMLYHETKTRR